MKTKRNGVFKSSSILVLLWILVLPMVQINTVQAAEMKYVYRVQGDYLYPNKHNWFNGRSGCMEYIGAYKLGLVAERLGNHWEVNDTYTPWLATSWTVTNESMTINLRRGVKWSDGTEFTARDVVCTFNVQRLKKHPIWDYVDDVSAVDNYTVRFHVTKPSYMITYYAIGGRDAPYMMPYSQYGQWNEMVVAAVKAKQSLTGLITNFTTFDPGKFVTTGPFVPQTITEKQQIWVKRNDYWVEQLGLGKIYWTGLEVTNVVPEYPYYLSETPPPFESTWCLTDIGITAQAIARFGPLIKVIKAPKYTGSSLILNFARYPLNVKEVRQAIAYAIDLGKCMAASYEHNSYDPKITGFPQVSMQLLMDKEIYKNLKSYTYDVKKAEQLMLSIGCTRDTDQVWKTANGTRLEFEVLAPNDGRQASTILAGAYLNEFGIKATVRSMEAATVTTYLQKGDFDITASFWGEYFPVRAAQQTYLDKMPVYLPPGLKGPSIPDVYEIQGQQINITAEAFKLAEGFDWRIQNKESFNKIAQVINEYLPIITFGERSYGFALNLATTEGWPEPVMFPNGSMNPLYGNMHLNPCIPYHILSGTVRPKGVLEKIELESALGLARQAIDAAQAASDKAKQAIAAAQAALDQAQLIGVVSVAVAVVAIVIALVRTRRTI